METIYVTEKQAKNYKVVEHYPNELIKLVKVNGESKRMQIIPTDQVVKVRLMTEKERGWYLKYNPKNKEVVSIETDWMPKELLVGVEKGVYSPITDLSIKTGWIPANGNAGTRTLYFDKDKLDVVIDILKAHNYNNFDIKL